MTVYFLSWFLWIRNSGPAIWAYLVQGLSCGRETTVAEISSKPSLLTQKAPDLEQLQ